MQRISWQTELFLWPLESNSQLKLGRRSHVISAQPSLKSNSQYCMFGFVPNHYIYIHLSHLIRMRVGSILKKTLKSFFRIWNQARTQTSPRFQHEAMVFHYRPTQVTSQVNIIYYPLVSYLIISDLSIYRYPVVILISVGLHPIHLYIDLGT